MARAIMHGMNVRVDKAGRMVLPKSVRDRLGLKKGGRLTIEESPDGITLRPLKESPRFVNENGIMVFVGKVPKDIDWEKLREEDREERFRDLWQR